jgi:4-alpha-glucanotransferase
MRSRTAILPDPMTAESAAQHLEELARVLGVTRSYYDGTGQARRACDDALVAVLRALGAPVERIEDATDALRAAREHRADGITTHVLEAGLAGEVVAGDLSASSAKALLALESADVLRLATEAIGDGRVRVTLPADLPAGYHRLDVEAGNVRRTHRLIVAPPRLPAAPRGWGLFAPLYALRSTRNPGMATYADLRRVAGWMTRVAPASSRGRDTAWLGTLPLLACYFEEPFEPSPYSPISRAFWSELYVDPRLAPESEHLAPAELAHAELAPADHAGAGHAPGAAHPRAGIDYRRAMRDRRAALESLLAGLDRRGGARRDAFERALEADDELGRYAAFRACVEREGRPWHDWPDRERDGTLRPGSDFDGEAFRYHAYAQWLAREQIAAAANDSPAGLYLDLPLGSHGGGYDTWRHAGEYASGVSVGAPPDAVFEGGQDWGFPPAHPGRAREAGYAGMRAALAHHFTHASMLRVDHVMGFHRLFWIPQGFSAADGVYVDYPARELWSVLAIEAARARGGRGAAVVGEDLGTVPDEVRAEMDARGALRMYVVPFEMRSDEHQPLNDPPGHSLACLGTHDMAPFASWWEEQRRPDLARFVGSESTEPRDVLRGLVAHLSASRADVVFANLEDFWLERERQNLPGTEAAETNWKRPFAVDTETFMHDEGVLELVRTLRGAP